MDAPTPGIARMCRASRHVRRQKDANFVRRARPHAGPLDGRGLSDDAKEEGPDQLARSGPSDVCLICSMRGHGCQSAATRADQSLAARQGLTWPAAASVGDQEEPVLLSGLLPTTDDPAGVVHRICEGQIPTQVRVHQFVEVGGGAVSPDARVHD